MPPGVVGVAVEVSRVAVAAHGGALVGAENTGAGHDEVGAAGDLDLGQISS